MSVRRCELSCVWQVLSEYELDRLARVEKNKKVLGQMVSAARGRAAAELLICWSAGNQRGEGGILAGDAAEEAAEEAAEDSSGREATVSSASEVS